MGRVADNKSEKKNRQQEKLRATPFDSVDELAREQKAIRLAEWRRLEKAKIIDELITKKDYAFIVDEWRSGLECFLSDDSDERLYKIFSEGRGLKVNLNKNLAESMGDSKSDFLASIVKGGIEGYGALFWRSKGVLPEDDSTPKPDIEVP